MMIPGIFDWLFSRPKLSLSWVLLLLNISVYFWIILNFNDWPSRGVVKELNDKNFSQSIEQMYRQTLDPVELKNLQEPLQLTQILRDHRFWKRIAHFPFKGDQVQIEINRKKLKNFYSEYLNSAQYNFGLAPINMSPWSWVTYQFTHASLAHLLGNILILFMLVSILEKSISSAWLASVYLFGGFGGGAFYLLYDSSGSMAVVGASAAVFALMAFAVIVLKEKTIPWFYFFFPSIKGYGTIYLPAFYLFPILMMYDFITLIWEPSGLSTSVAVSAHVGGAITGFLLGLMYLYEQALEKYLLKIWKIDPHF